MKYAIHEDPATHAFVFIPLPHQFVDGDELPVLTTGASFSSYDDAVAALPDLLNRDECEPAISEAKPAPAG